MTIKYNKKITAEKTGLAVYEFQFLEDGQHRVYVAFSRNLEIARKGLKEMFTGKLEFKLCAKIPLWLYLSPLVPFINFKPK